MVSLWHIPIHSTTALGFGAVFNKIRVVEQVPRNTLGVTWQDTWTEGCFISQVVGAQAKDSTILLRMWKIQNLPMIYFWNFPLISHCSWLVNATMESETSDWRLYIYVHICSSAITQCVLFAISCICLLTLWEFPPFLNSIVRLSGAPSCDCSPPWFSSSYQCWMCCVGNRGMFAVLPIYFCRDTLGLDPHRTDPPCPSNILKFVFICVRLIFLHHTFPF